MGISILCATKAIFLPWCHIAGTLSVLNSTDHRSTRQGAH